MPAMKTKSRYRVAPAIILTVVLLTFLFVWGIGDSYLLSTETETIQQQHDSDPSSSEDNKNDNKKSHHQQLEVAWLMSFGGAGTSYTITNIETVTGRSTASNYGDDYDPCIPVYEHWTNGPFLRSPRSPLPDKFILTKTHCAGYCMDCGPGAYYLTEEEFFKGCLTGKKHVEGGHETVTYDPSIPKKAVHLIRNPFDNLVGRMHLYNKHNGRHDNHSHFDTTVEGLQSWCSFLDDKYAESEKNVPVLQEYKHVPCHGEWYKYIQWHNLAYKAQQKLNLPVHYLYYDHYSTQHAAAVDGVLEFLEEPRRNDALPFLPGKTYRDIFTEEHVKDARKMTKALMKPKLWKLIKHYFE